MKKILFAAASLPVLMASCTQDVIESEMNPGNTPNAKGFQLELNATKGDNAITRGYKTDSHSMVFEGTDQINMFWLNTDPEDNNYSQTFNSIFNIEKQEGEASSFKSKSLVYGGYNVATFPGQYTTSTGDIVLTVSNKPGGIVNIPYMSNLINLDCKNNKQDNNQISGNLQKGFNNKLSMPMKQTANFAELDIEFSKIATDIKGYEDGMKVEKITFVSDAAAFAEKAYIRTEDNSVATNGNWSYIVADEVKNVTPIVAETKTVPVPSATSYELVSTAVTVENNGNTSATTTGKAYLMSFPTDANTTTGSIIINTNMGIVTIETVIEGTGDDAVNKTPLFNSDNKNVTVESAFDLLAAYHTNSKGLFKDEIVGKYVPRTLKVDMTKAVIDGSVVKSSADIVRYVNLYNKLGKEDNMTLVLHEAFTGLDAEALGKLNSNDNFKLDASNVTSITLLGGGDVESATPKAAKFEGLADPFTFNLEGGKEWAMSQKINVITGSKTYKYNNLGTLTISAGDNNTAVAYELTNAGTVNFTGDVELGKYTANQNSTTTIAASQNITFLGNTTLNGTVTVASAAQLLAGGAADVKIGTTGVINNSGFIAVQIGGSGAKITNIGTINVVDNASTTLITKNEEGTNIGTINLNARNNEVAVGDASYQGYIAILTSKLTDPSTYSNATGDKMNKLVVDAGNITIDEDAFINYVQVKENAAIYNKNKKELKITTLTVNNGKTLNIPTGQVIEVATSTTINQNAKIIVGGTLYYGACGQLTQIYTTGSEATVKAAK